jgi:glyoxylase-like metal-dependent hydrolase (beta-lactamase superfamily II)
MSPYIHNRNDLRASIERLKGIRAAIVYPGHGKSFPFEKIRDFIVEFPDGA